MKSHRAKMVVLPCFFIFALLFFYQSAPLKRLAQLAAPQPPADPLAVPRENRPLSVFVVTQCRSGSSFMGEIFNRRRNVTYFYEPLYPFRKANCYAAEEESVRKMSVALVENIARCRFANMSRDYRTALAKTKQRDEAGCVRSNMCFAGCDKCSKFLQRDPPFVYDRLRRVDPRKLDRHCRHSEFRAAKLNYLPQISDVTHLMAADDVNVKVVHLVRDPRATTSSRFRSTAGLVRHIHHFDEISKDICNRMYHNVVFANQRLIQQVPNKFMRIRYEDLALDPIYTIEKVYDLIGRPLTAEVRQWVQQATTAKSKEASQARVPSDAFGTRRNSSATVEAWRQWMSPSESRVVEKNCAKVMQLLGYLPLDGRLTDLQLPSFDENLPSFL